MKIFDENFFLYFEEFDLCKSVIDKGENVFTSKDLSTPNTYQILECYPNPFNGSLKIQYEIAEASFVNIKVFSINGRLVNDFDMGKLFAGKHSLIWDGLSKDGRSLPTGIYIISLNTTNSIINKKVLFLK